MNKIEKIKIGDKEYNLELLHDGKYLIRGKYQMHSFVTLTNLKDVYQLNNAVKERAYYVLGLNVYTDEIKSFKEIAVPYSITSQLNIYGSEFDFDGIQNITFFEYEDSEDVTINIQNSKYKNFTKFKNIHLIEVDTVSITESDCENLIGLESLKNIRLLYLHECHKLKSLIGCPNLSNRLLTIDDCPNIDPKWIEWLKINYDVEIDIY